MTLSGRVVVPVRVEASSCKVGVPVRVEESSMLSRNMKAKTEECDGKTRGKTSATLLLVSVWDGGNCSWYPILGRVGSWYLNVGSIQSFHPPCTQDWVGPCLSML
jgi:hypothetical protein